MNHHRFKVTYKDYCLFYCMAWDPDDALSEAKTIALRNGYKSIVIANLAVRKE